MRIAFSCALLIYAVVASNLRVSASITRTQSLHLRAGWNAVFLEVAPTKTEPETFFAKTPVDIAASFYASGSTAQFVSDPSVDLLGRDGWAVWYAENRPDHFLRTLDAVFGQRAYLIHSKADFDWAITGTVILPDIQWQPDSYNFVGFPVDATSPPTFAEFFGSSKAHQSRKVFRLVNEGWRRVVDPSTETMRQGESFWIFCEGASDFAGPLKVEAGLFGLMLIDQSTGNLVIRNTTDHKISVVLRHLANGDDSVPLSILVRTAGGSGLALTDTLASNKPVGDWEQALPPILGAGAVNVPFQARSRELTRATQSSLIRIVTDIGVEAWIPVTAVRPDLIKSK